MKKLGILLFLVIAALALLPGTADAHWGCSSVSQLSTGSYSFQLKYYCYTVNPGPWYAPWQTTTTRTYRAENVPNISSSLNGKPDGCSIPSEYEGITFPSGYRSELRYRFQAACNQHDACYANFASYITKERCDRDFLRNLNFICDHVIAKVPGCYGEAFSMYTAVALSDAAHDSFYDRR